MSDHASSNYLFSIKAWILRTIRFFRDLRSKETCAGKICTEAEVLNGGYAIAGESVTPLWTIQTGEAREFAYNSGKVENLRVALSYLNHRAFRAEEVFSFWKCMPRPTIARGFVAGRELREGCILPSVGGGLCQLSNGIYDAALRANFSVVERHAHTQVIPGSLAEIDRDATVFWNYMDLRLRCREACVLDLELTDQDLIVRWLVKAPAVAADASKVKVAEELPLKTADTIFADFGGASINHGKTANCTYGVTAFLVDDYSPEFDEWIQQERAPNDWLFAPVNGPVAWLYNQNDLWSEHGFQRVLTASQLWRKFHSSRERAPKESYKANGKSRKSRKVNDSQEQLAWSKSLADFYKKSLSPAVTHLVVSQRLFTPLMENGAFGGRIVDVLVDQDPADDLVVRAQRVVTTNPRIARCFGKHAVILPLHVPTMPPLKQALAKAQHQPRVLFLGSCNDHGAVHCVRAVFNALNISVLLPRGEAPLVSEWGGVNVEVLVATESDLELLALADAVIVGLSVNGISRLALKAVGMGIPVIAPEHSGITHVAGVYALPRDDRDALMAIFEEIFAERLVGIKTNRAQTAKPALRRA